MCFTVALFRVLRPIIPALVVVLVVAGSTLGTSSLRVAVLIDATFAVTLAILSESALSFLGFGFSVPDTSLGLLVSTGQSAIATRPWLFYLPGAFLTILCALVHVIGDGLCAALGHR